MGMDVKNVNNLSVKPTLNVKKKVSFFLLQKYPGE